MHCAAAGCSYRHGEHPTACGSEPAGRLTCGSRLARHQHQERIDYSSLIEPLLAFWAPGVTPTVERFETDWQVSSRGGGTGELGQNRSLHQANARGHRIAQGEPLSVKLLGAAVLPVWLAWKPKV